MSWIGYAIVAGWFTVSGQTAATNEIDTKAASKNEQLKEEDLAWKKRLLATSEKDPWHVGANMGKELVQIPGKRPHSLLKANWKKIPVSVRKQILKGFTPGMMGNEEMHEQFFNVMHLGMSDKNAGVRSFAAGYLEMQGLPNFERDLNSYKKWREKTEKLSSVEVLKLIESQPAQQLSSEQHTAKRLGVMETATVHGGDRAFLLSGRTRSESSQRLQRARVGPVQQWTRREGASGFPQSDQVIAKTPGSTQWSGASAVFPRGVETG